MGIEEGTSVKSMSEILRERIKASGKTFHANDNISEFIQSPEELQQLQDEVERRVAGLLNSLVIDTENDHNTQETAKRVAKMYVREMYHGRYLPAPDITDFPNAKKLDEIYSIGPITLHATCSHHLVPIEGECWVGVLPGSRVIGLSKFNRMVTWIMSRPHIQEEAAMMLADKLQELTKAEGLGVVIRAKHMCMTCRGVRERSDVSMVNSVVRGEFKDNPDMKREFFDLIKAQGFQHG